MKQAMLIVSILLLGNNLKAQIVTNTEAADYTNIYYASFKKYCEQINKKPGIMFVEENFYITNILTTEISGNKIEIVTIADLKKLLKDRKQMQLLRLIPLRVKDGDFYVNIVVFNVKFRHKQFDFVNQGGISVVYSYDTKDKAFVFKNIK